MARGGEQQEQQAPRLGRCALACSFNGQHRRVPGVVLFCLIFLRLRCSLLKNQPAPNSEDGTHHTAAVNKTAFKIPPFPPQPSPSRLSHPDPRCGARSRAVFFGSVRVTSHYLLGSTVPLTNTISDSEHSLHYKYCHSVSFFTPPRHRLIHGAVANQRAEAGYVSLHYLPRGRHYCSQSLRCASL